MKAAVILSTLTLAVVLNAAVAYKHGGHGHGGKVGKFGKHNKFSDVTIIDPLMEGFGESHDGFIFKTLGGLKYSYLYHERNSHGVFATGTVIEQGDKCGLKGLFSCGKSCGGEDPVCKAVFTQCGVEKCRSNEVCVDGTCYPYVCESGYKCFQGAKKVCGQECRTASKVVCRDEKVYVCGAGVGGGRRLAGGSGYNSQYSGGDGAWGGSGASGSFVNGVNGFFDPSHSGFGFGHGGCGFITKEVCEEEPYELCEEVCAIKEGFHCTDEICGSDPEMVACGRGYCRLGDMCYQPSCDHACKYNKKHFCW